MSRMGAARLHAPRHFPLTRLFALGLLLFVMGCAKDEQGEAKPSQPPSEQGSAPATPQHPERPTAAAQPKLDEPSCSLKALSPEHVAKVLGTTALRASNQGRVGADWTCRYVQQDRNAPFADVHFIWNTRVSRSSFDAGRERYQKSMPGTPVRDYDKLGDTGFVQAIDGTKGLQINLLGVLASETLFYVTATAPVEKIHTLIEDVLQELKAAGP